MSDRPLHAAGDAARRWNVPLLEDSAAGGSQDAIRRARDEGFEQGRREGLAAAQAEVQAQLGLLRSMTQALTAPLAELDERVEKELVTLALAVARQVIYREVRTDPELVVEAVRKSLDVLPVGTQEIRLHLHPEDAQLVRVQLSDGDEEFGCEIVEDRLSQRGGCRVSTHSSQVDASLDARLDRVIAAVLGESGESV